MRTNLAKTRERGARLDLPRSNHRHGHPAPRKRRTATWTTGRGGARQHPDADARRNTVGAHNVVDPSRATTAARTRRKRYSEADVPRRRTHPPGDRALRGMDRVANHGRTARSLLGPPKRREQPSAHRSPDLGDAQRNHGDVCCSPPHLRRRWQRSTIAKRFACKVMRSTPGSTTRHPSLRSRQSSRRARSASPASALTA